MTIPHSPIVPPSRCILLGLCVLMLLLSACTEEVETKLLLNGQTFASHPLQPKASDTEGYLKLINTPGVAVIAVDRSEPSTEVSARKWTVTDPDGQVAQTAEDVPNLELSFDRPGWYSVGLEVNGQEEDAVTNWLLVEGSEVPEDFTDKEDGFWIISPASDGMETEERDYELRMHTNLYDESELENISVTLNEREVKGLVFDGEELVTSADVKLKKGKNTIKVIAEIDGEEYREELSLVRRVDDPEPIVHHGSVVDNSSVDRTPSTGEEKKAPPPTPDFEGKETSTAYARREAIGGCMSSGQSSMRFTLTADRRISLESFVIHTDACGEAELRVSKGSGTTLGSRRGITLVKGPNELFLNTFILERMAAGERWTIDLRMSANAENNCASPPHLLDLGSCAGKSVSEKNLSLSAPGKKIIEKLNYTY